MPPFFVGLILLRYGLSVFVCPLYSTLCSCIVAGGVTWSRLIKMPYNRNRLFNICHHLEGINGQLGG